MKSPFDRIGLTANAEEVPKIPNGVYQVELSFLSGEDEQFANILNKQALLTVEKEKYLLSVPILDGKIWTIDTVKQQGEALSYLLNQVENLVQFDVEHVQKPIEMTGIFAETNEEIPVYYTKQLHIDVKKLLASINKEETDEVEKVEEEVEEEENDEEIEDSEGMDDEKVEEDENDDKENGEGNENDEEVDEKPLPPTNDEEIEEAFINYLLLAAGTNKPSIMNTYIEPLMKLIRKDGKVYAQMKILKSSWVTDLKVKQGDKIIALKTISLVNNIRVVQFEVTDFAEVIQFFVRVDIPEISYHHAYDVQLQWDEEQLAAFLGEPIEPIIPKPTIPKPELPNMENQITGNRNTGNQNTEIPNREVINLVNTSKEKLENSIKQPIEREAAVKVSKASERIHEEPLSFNRTLDEAVEKVIEEPNVEEEEEQAIELNTFDTVLLDKMKVILLVIICLLSGILLVLRLKNAKKVRDDA